MNICVEVIKIHNQVKRRQTFAHFPYMQKFSII